MKTNVQKILVTGGTGYIGSHTVVGLQDQGYDVVIVDDLSNSTAGVVDGIEKITGKRPELEIFDLSEREKAVDFFRRHPDLQGIIHFAAYKSVNESVERPLSYYRNNLLSLIHVLEGMQAHKIPFLVFSSSCTVYGQPSILPVTEECPVQKAFSPYGNTKQVSEEIIEDTCKVAPVQSVALRYFNPIGAHPSALIGELPIGIPNNLMPYITQTAIGKREILNVYGSDYHTPDGTAIRDYIHVADIAAAHVKALEYMSDKADPGKMDVFNVGAGRGYSVMEVIQSFEKVTGVKLNYRMAPRRPGDIERIWASTEKANRLLRWKAGRTLDEMTLSAWKWELSLNTKQ
jgi:UDP-glucose 4-epimerase